jgi:hypothetical protein
MTTIKPVQGQSLYKHHLIRREQQPLSVHQAQYQHPFNHVQFRDGLYKFMITDQDTLKILNIILNSSTGLILGLISKFKIHEKTINIVNCILN